MSCLKFTSSPNIPVTTLFSSVSILNEQCLSRHSSLTLSLSLFICLSLYLFLSLHLSLCFSLLQEVFAQQAMTNVDLRPYENLVVKLDDKTVS